MKDFVHNCFYTILSVSYSSILLTAAVYFQCAQESISTQFQLPAL